MNRTQNIIIRYLIFIFGLAINAFGIALITKAGLGTSPISSVPYVLSLVLPSFSFGLWSFIINMLFILIQVLLLKKDFAPVQFLQIAANVLFSYGIDLAMNILSFFSPASWISSLAALVLGCAVLGLGIAFEVAPGVIMVPGEGMVSAISQVSRLPFAAIKNLFDLSLMITAAAISLLCTGTLSGIGTGTLISAVLVGRFVSLFNSHLGILERIRGLADGAEADPVSETDELEEVLVSGQI